MKSDNNILNSTNATLNKDGTFTAYFGSAEAFGDVANRLDVTPGWIPDARLSARAKRP